MRRRLLFRLLMCALLLAGAALVAVSKLSTKGEPAYAGRPLSEWVLLYARLDPVKAGSPATSEAAQAIRHIGTNALPLMVRWIQYEPPRWKHVLKPIAAKLHLPLKIWNRKLIVA